MDYFDELETRLAELTTAGAHLRGRRRLGLAWRRSPVPGLVLAVSVLVVAAVAALALSARSSSPRPGPAGQPSAAISPLLVRDYRILRRPVRPSDALPAVFARNTSGYELAPALARRVLIPDTRIAMWLEPGRNGFCVYLGERPASGSNQTRGVSASCGPVQSATPLVGLVAADANLAVGPPALGFSANEPDLARGIVPDDVTSLVLAPAHGKPVQIRPTEGFFAMPFRLGDRLYAIRHGQADQILPAGTSRRPRVSAP